MPIAEDTAKLCSDCQKVKPVDDFYHRKDTGRPYGRCKSCHYDRTQTWRAANRHRIREWDRARYPRVQAQEVAEKRLKKYGLTADQFAALWEKQGGACPICLNPLPESTLGMSSGDWTLPSVDHCHKTGVVRGILHRRCNLALEFLLTDEEVKRARDYLRGH